MILETILFTALPTRREGNDLYASVLISPQLGGEEGNPRRLPLSRYQDFRGGAWVDIVNAIDWQLTLRWSVDDRQEDYLDAVRISPDANRELFATLFPDDMPVDPFAFRNIGDARLLSYPAARVDQDLDALQRAIAGASPEIRPLTRQLVSESGGYGKLPMDGFILNQQRRAQATATIDAMLAEAGVVTTPSGGQEATATSLAMLERVLQPSALAGQARKVRWPELDFHAVVSLLQSHPNLLRRLGLLVDLRIPITRIRSNTGEPRVYAMIDWPPPYNPDQLGLDITTMFPRVRTTLGDKYFRPKPATNDLDNTGFVRLSDARAITSTLESEAIATQATATGLDRVFQQGRETFGTPDRSGIPARHSAGVEIVRPDEAERWKSRMQRANNLEDSLRALDDILLDAEDVVMGYRLDVRKVGERTWHSLHRRHGVLTPYVGRSAGKGVDLGDDEGWAEAAATGNPEDEGALEDQEFRMRETLVQWDGWSLSIPKPGKALNDNDRPAPPTPAEEAEALIDSMHGTIDYSAPDSGARLPALRFSTTDYEARLRWVDIGGNSEAPDAAGGSILRFPYLRHDPVPSPDLYLTSEPVWSEASDVLVLRTANVAADNRKSTQRWIAPPKSAAFFCLAHGVFDDDQGRPRAGMFGTIASRESEVIATEVIDGDVHIVPADPGAVPYLPDPLADGLLIRGGPKQGRTYDAEATVGYRGSWPNVQVAQIEAKAVQAGRNRTRTAGDKVTVELEPGRVAHLRMSHSLTGDGLSLMDLWRRIRGNGNEARARKGAYWMLTPDRVVTVVHAVQRPVAAPEFVRVPRNKRWKAQRSAGDTAATLSGFLTVDAPSTDSVDMHGVRTYAVDDGPGTGAPYVVVNADMGVVGTDSVEDPAPGGGETTVPLTVRAAFADTRRQQVTLTAEAKSRFAEYFRKSITAAAASDIISLNGGRPVVAGSPRITWRTFDDRGRATDGTATDGMFTLDPSNGTVILHPDEATGERIPTTAVLTISFIPGPITRSSTESAVPSSQRRASVTVPSSARPLAPQAEWILPAFEWSGPSGNRRTSTRSGGLLRIYLARPWFSSGIGEELAIVLEPANAGARNPSRDALVTQWGLDPITTGANLPRSGAPLQRHFTNTNLRASNVRLAEMDALVDIVRYRIGSHNERGQVSSYDADRDMYFVDIEMDHGGAYRPFVRLALARYQPSSVGDLQLSPVTMVDVVQLEPDRTASVAISGSGVKQTASVTLTGPSYRANEAGDGPGLARAILERYDGPTGPKVNPALSAAWTALQTVTMRGQINDSGNATWTGRLTVPKSRPGGTYRIVIEQFEEIRTDGNAGNSGKTVGERLVHQDIIGI